MAEIKRTETRNRVLLAGLCCAVLSDFESTDEETMSELRELVKTAGGEAVIEAVQNRRAPDPHMFIGEGKAQELAELIKQQEIDLVVFDNEISPSQTRALEGALSCRVIDRNALILDIFADRAKTAEGKLQVELAQYKYMLPRLTHMWTHLVRQTASGGSSPIGTRGPGETQLETDRRHIRRKIQKLESEIEDVKTVRATQRQRRQKNRIPLVCLVGYTNAGKSTLLNALTGAGVHAEGRLFDTLDPTVKMMKSGEMGDILVSDTVGFIRKLPHHLVDAFKATLEELTFADVLVHVVDASAENWQAQADVVDKLIVELGAEKTPRIVLYNKIDLLRDSQLPRDGSGVYCSALKGVGLDSLMGAIEKRLGEESRLVSFTLPYASAAVLDMLYRDANVKRADYDESGIIVEAVCDKTTLGRIRGFLPEA